MYTKLLISFWAVPCALSISTVALNVRQEKQDSVTHHTLPPNRIEYLEELRLVDLGFQMMWTLPISNILPLITKQIPSQIDPYIFSTEILWVDHNNPSHDPRMQPRGLPGPACGSTSFPGPSASSDIPHHRLPSLPSRPQSGRGPGATRRGSNRSSTSFSYCNRERLRSPDPNKSSPRSQPILAGPHRRLASQSFFSFNLFFLPPLQNAPDQKKPIVFNKFKKRKKWKRTFCAAMFTC